MEQERRVKVGDLPDAANEFFYSKAEEFEDFLCCHDNVQFNLAINAMCICLARIAFENTHDPDIFLKDIIFAIKRNLKELREKESLSP